MSTRHVLMTARSIFIAAGLMLMGGGSAFAASTYTFVGLNYSSVTNNTTCTVGTCASYAPLPTTQHIAGNFTTNTPLAPNLADAAFIPASYSFNDGVNTIADSTPAQRIIRFKVTTNASGAITSARIIVMAWTTGVSPHTTADRANAILINADTAANNAACSAVGIAPESGIADTCNPAFDANVSFAQQPTQGVWTSPSIGSVPTLSQWAFAALAIVLAGGGLVIVRRRAAA
jgi:hypothetical protein